MEHDILNALRKYPVGDIDPLENFVTEAWAWLLKSDANLLSAFLHWFFEVQTIDGEELTVQTQVKVKSGYIDLLISSETLCVVFEHKIDSGFGDQQVEKYVRDLKKSASILYCGTIARYPHQTEAIAGSKKAVSATWSEVSEWLAEYVESSVIDDVVCFFAKSFIKLLKEEGMGATEPINNQALSAYFQISDVDVSLKQLFLNIRESIDWSKYKKLVSRSDGKKGPRSITRRWGRIGIEMSRPEDWAPGVFFGVIVDPDDHGVMPQLLSAGPDLCLIVDVNDVMRKLISKGETTAEYKSVSKDLEKIAANNGFEFIDLARRPGKKQNYWHPLYLRQPLSLVLKGKAKFQDQQQAIQKLMVLLFDELLKLDNFAALKRAWPK